MLSSDLQQETANLQGTAPPESRQRSPMRGPRQAQSRQNQVQLAVESAVLCSVHLEQGSVAANRESAEQGAPREPLVEPHERPETGPKLPESGAVCSLKRSAAQSAS